MPREDPAPLGNHRFASKVTSQPWPRDIVEAGDHAFGGEDRQACADAHGVVPEALRLERSTQGQRLLGELLMTAMPERVDEP